MQEALVNDSNLTRNIVNLQDMYLNNFTKDKDDVFEEVSYVANALNVQSEILKEEDEIEIKEEKLCEFEETHEKVMAVDTVKLESIGRIQQTEITSNPSEILIIKSENVGNICHSIKSPSQAGEEEQFYFCDMGDYQTKNKLLMNRHCLLHDDNAELLNCSKFVYSATSKRDLPSLMRTHETKPKTFHCQKCDYETRTHTTLVTHMLLHQGNSNFRCHNCSYQAKRKSTLVRHMLIHQENYNFKCDKCSYQAKRKGSLVDHMLVHNKNYYFGCHKCSYQSKTKAHLVRHMLVHQENYNFPCDKCSYRAKIKSNLVRHMLRHQEDYNFSCDKCSYRAKTKFNLVRHMLLHQEDYNFTCNKCSYQTKRKSNLVEHMVIHQDNYNFSCDKCNYRAKIKSSLVRHMSRHQKGKKFRPNEKAFSWTEII